MMGKSSDVQIQDPVKWPLPAMTCKLGDLHNPDPIFAFIFWQGISKNLKSKQMDSVPLYKKKLFWLKKCKVIFLDIILFFQHTQSGH